MNDEEVLKLLDAGPGSIVPKLATEPSNETITEQLYLQIFSRLPDATEKKETVDFLAAADLRQSIKDLAWAMLTSTEFVVNH